LVHGGSATAMGDRLLIVDDGVADLTLYRKAMAVTEGNVTVGPANAEPFETAFDGIERVQFLETTGVPINQDTSGSPNSGNGNPANRLMVFSMDMSEYNDDRYTSTNVGASLTSTLTATIDPGAILNPFGDGMDIAGDEDWFKVQAQVSGTLDFQTLFDEIGTLPSGRPGLPGNGDLDIYVYDADGTLIAGNGPLWGGNNGSGANPELNVDGDTFAENERIRIPAVQGQTYYLRHDQCIQLERDQHGRGCAVRHRAPGQPGQRHDEPAGHEPQQRHGPQPVRQPHVRQHADVHLPL
jgi:hypothetical protein